MIYDCFTFFNEFDLLEERIAVLSPLVEKFVIVQGKRTFQGAPKPVYDLGHIPKSVHVYVDLDTPDDDWGREYKQRNAIVHGLLKAEDTDWVIISDVDEIPDPKAVLAYPGKGIAALEMDLFYYNEHTRCKHKWHRARITTVETLRTITPNQVRLATEVTVIPNGGRHLSCFGGAKKIQEKMAACSHREYNTPEFTNLEHLERCIKEGVDFLGRGIEFERIAG